MNLTGAMAIIMLPTIGIFLMMALIGSTVLWWKPTLIFVGLYLVIVLATASFEYKFLRGETL